MKDIIEFIPYGKENAISQEDLADVMHCGKRTVRALIFSARTKGAVICSTCEGTAGGYYIPLTANGARPYVAMQESRIKSAVLALNPVRDFIINCDKGEVYEYSSEN